MCVAVCIAFAIVPSVKACLCHMPLGACFILFLTPQCCQQVDNASLHPYSLFLQTFSEDLSTDESRCLGTPLIELGIPPRKVAALLMKG